MANVDKLILWGAAAVMAAVGSLSVWKISHGPRLDPAVARAAEELIRIANDPAVKNPPPPVPVVRTPDVILADVHPATDWGASLPTKFVGIPKPRVRMEYLFLPIPAPGEAKADLDKMVVTWTVSPRTVELKDWMIRKDAPPTGFIIHRQCEDGPVEVVGKVGPKERSFTDLSTEPRLTYRYWVELTGDESVYDSYPPAAKPATKGLNLSAEARTPSATRVKLVGGDQANGILKVETYDRAQKKWVGRLVQTAPGRPVGSSGWTLNRLRFDNFTLVADVTDDEGVDRVLNTKN